MFTWLTACLACGTIIEIVRVAATGAIGKLLAVACFGIVEPGNKYDNIFLDNRFKLDNHVNVIYPFGVFSDISVRKIRLRVRNANSSKKG